MAKSFLKKSPEVEVKATVQPVFDKKNNVFFVNPEKYDRAKDILALITGQKVAQKAEEEQRRDHYTRQLTKHEVDPKSEDAIPAIYELLGGLIRSSEEQKDAELRAKEAQKKGKKRLIE